MLPKKHDLVADDINWVVGKFDNVVKVLKEIRQKLGEETLS